VRSGGARRHAKRALGRVCCFVACVLTLTHHSCDAILNALTDSSVTCSTLSASGCDCHQCKCHPSTGKECNAIGRSEECGDQLVCALWPSGQYFIGGMERVEMGRRKLFGDMIGNAKICVPKDWL